MWNGLEFNDASCWRHLGVHNFQCVDVLYFLLWKLKGIGLNKRKQVGGNYVQFYIAIWRSWKTNKRSLSEGYFARITASLLFKKKGYDCCIQVTLRILDICGAEAVVVGNNSLSVSQACNARPKVVSTKLGMTFRVEASYEHFSTSMVSA
jgi:hypothetical protein